jgi:hypothetical protein
MSMGDRDFAAASRDPLDFFFLLHCCFQNYVMFFYTPSGLRFTLLDAI